MFSGGLDSLAGAVECAARGERIALVSHRPTPLMSKRQHELVAALRVLHPAAKVLHVPVWVNKDKRLGREHTQRTRSFLFTALGTVVAQSLRAKNVTFFENGVVSINLPVADEVLNARASRTTHPDSLRELTKLVGLITERPLVVENPYLFETKRDVVARLAGPPAKLIGLTCSCAHTGIFQSGTQWHCGACSQCIDRKIALVHAGLDSFEATNDYKTDVLRGPRKQGPDRNIAVDYARHAIELARMSNEAIATRFMSELSRAARALPPASQTAERLVAMHKRHGEVVFGVLADQMKLASEDLLSGSLDKSSLLGLLGEQRHSVSSWSRYAERIVEVLQAGLPAACQTDKPSNEPRLQELCDALLRSAGENLAREYPQLSWGSTKTKPDWSRPGTTLWVELKYVRTKKDVGEVSRAIAQDVTLYGDNDRKVLFAVFDPGHLVIDEQEFGKHVAARDDMFVRFIR
jgi:7-cyano-7-deazaguanine synthase in queuosine biosynthesis